MTPPKKKRETSESTTTDQSRQHTPRSTRSAAVQRQFGEIVNTDSNIPVFSETNLKNPGTTQNVDVKYDMIM